MIVQRTHHRFSFLSSNVSDILCYGISDLSSFQQGPNLTSAQYQNRVPTTTSFDPPHSPQLVFPSSSVTVPVYFQTLSQNQQTNPPPNGFSLLPTIFQKKVSLFILEWLL
jgi:hypothetical protein